MVDQPGDLVFEARVPERPHPGALTIVLLHGRGSDEHDLMALSPLLPQDAMIVAPRAPHAGSPWGYGPGWAWYRYEGDDRPEVESFRSSQAALRRFLGSLDRRLPVPPGDLVVGGFSQGGTMSLGLGLGPEPPTRRVFNLSGFLPNHPDVDVSPLRARGLDVFWGHGAHDPAIPIDLARSGRAALVSAQATVTQRDYVTGHGIVHEELTDLGRWLLDDGM